MSSTQDASNEIAWTMDGLANRCKEQQALIGRIRTMCEVGIGGGQWRCRLCDGEQTHSEDCPFWVPSVPTDGRYQGATDRSTP